MSRGSAARVDERRAGPSSRRGARGFTLIEVVIVIAIIGIVSALTLPNVDRYMESTRARAAAKSVADAFTFARAQAIRSGANHVVFFSIRPATPGNPLRDLNGNAGDVLGNMLTDASGNPAPILVLNDGAPGSANQNCVIDAGEETVTFEAQQGVGWGFNAPAAAQTPPDEEDATIPSTGTSFKTPDGLQTTWVMFRPDGVPVAIDAACTAGRLGTGGGSIYLWSQNRDFAITLSPLGGVRVHVWNASTGGWST